MSSRQAIDILLTLPGPGYDLATQSFNTHLSPYIVQMEKAAAGDGPLSLLQAIHDYVAYSRWPIRQLEYSFAIGCLPSEPEGRALDIGSGVTPWPYLLAGRGWPTVAVDLAVDQVTAMRRHGLAAFGSLVDHRVADVRGLGFDQGQFSLVTCLLVLEQLQHADVPVALAEMIRVCQPGGRIILTVNVDVPEYPGVPTIKPTLPLSLLERTLGPVARACGVDEAFEAALDAQRQLDPRDLETFWAQHWKPGLWQENNRGYGALGLVFDLPADAQKCRDLITALREIALAMEYPPPGQPYHQIQLPDGQKLWMIGDSVLTNALATERFESDVQSFFEQFVRAGDTVFDVGANVGLYEPLLSRLVGANGQVYAFEPTGQVFGCLVRNCLASDQNIRLNRIGLSHENDALTLLHGNDGNASLNSFGEPFGAGSAGAGTYASEVAWVATLDDYVRDYTVAKIDVLKIDVEGWEERVLRGGIKTLLALAPVLVLEFCSPAARNADSSCAAISELLAAMEYDLFRYQPADRSLEFIEPSRDAWSFANLIGVKRGALPFVLARLRGEAVPAMPAPGARRASNGREQVSLSRYDTHDILLLLEENRSLRQRLTSGILDREVTTLYHDLQVSDADRAARLAVIERQAAELSRLPSLEADIEHLKARLAASEADQAERLVIIERQGAELGRIPGLEADIEYLQAQLRISEADRAARLEVIERQGAELARIPRLEADIERLNRTLYSILAQKTVKFLGRLNLIKFDRER